MKFLIVDDRPDQSRKIAVNLMAIPGNAVLSISEAEKVDELLNFEIDIDVALVDLRLKTKVPESDNTDGYSVCQKLAHHFPRMLVVGYSSSLNVDSNKTDSTRRQFEAMGADQVMSAAELSITPIKELSESFKASLIEKRNDTDNISKKVFIGSSSKFLEVARLIQSQLQDYEVEIWDQVDAFSLGTTTIEALETACESYAFGIFVFAPDDLVAKDGDLSNQQAWAPRDNVLFEAGLFVGKLGRARTFIVTPKQEIKLPTDLYGVTTARFDHTLENQKAALGPACQKIREAISRLLSPSED